MIPDSHFAANVQGEFLTTINWGQYHNVKRTKPVEHEPTVDRKEQLLARKRAAEEKLKRSLCAAVRYH